MSRNIIMLTPEEEKEIKDLKRNYNIIPEPDVYDYRASRRTQVSRPGAILFLQISIFLNILTIVIVFFTFTVFVLKPAPLYYASHPSGSVYGPLPKYK